MGKSAKLHNPKKLKTGGGPNTNPGSGPSTQPSSSSTASRLADADAAKKHAALKAKAKSKPSGPTASSSGKAQGVLGGADYVALMMGGRKKAREEAKKLPPKEDANKMQL